MAKQAKTITELFPTLDKYNTMCSDEMAKALISVEVVNPFSGARVLLPKEQYYLYNMIITISRSCQSLFTRPEQRADIKLMQKGLNWFRKNNLQAYMKLLD